MKSLLLRFTFISIIAIIFADIEIVNLNPWDEFKRISYGLISPDFKVIFNYKNAIINTFAFAVCGITLAVLLSIPLALFYNNKLIKYFCSFIRSIHEIFWAFIILQLVGLNPVCGILAIAIPYSGIFAKVFYEINEESDKISFEVYSSFNKKLSNFIYFSIPIIINDITNYTKYRLECAIRSSAILGFIGLPTIGFYLETAFREGMYSESAALLYIFFIIIAFLKYIIKLKFLPIILLSSIYFISFEINFSWENLTRFFTYDILPWPMKRDGFYNQTYIITLNIKDTIYWFLNILKTEGLIGIWNTIILTQIGLFCTGVFAYFTFPLASKNLSHPIIRKFSHFILIIFRTTPEYILAYLFLLFWGPSMLPAIFAIFIHNGSILAFLTANNSDLIKIKFDNLNRKFNNFFYEITPKISGQFFAFLFYRWEVIMRESAILGLLGITSLGFFIDSAIADHQLDKAMVLILITAILNIMIDLISQYIRKKYRISTKMTISR